MVKAAALAVFAAVVTSAIAAPARVSRPRATSRPQSLSNGSPKAIGANPVVPTPKGDLPTPQPTSFKKGSPNAIGATPALPTPKGDLPRATPVIPTPKGNLSHATARPQSFKKGSPNANGATPAIPTPKGDLSRATPVVPSPKSDLPRATFGPQALKHGSPNANSATPAIPTPKGGLPTSRPQSFKKGSFAVNGAPRPTPLVATPKRDLEFVEVEARRRRGGSRGGPRSSTTDKISAGIGAAQLATDVAGLVVPKDIESAEFEIREFFDDELEARDFQELEARRRGGGRRGPRSSTTAKIQAGIDGAQLATDVAGLVIPKRSLVFVNVEARRRRGGHGGRSGPRSSMTDKISAGIGAAQVATDVAGLVTAREFDLEMLD